MNSPLDARTPGTQAADATPARTSESAVEPWLRGTLTHIDSVRRQALHALELTSEDIHRWCAPLSDAELNARSFDLPSVAFQLRHIGRSLDRLLTYAENRQLSAVQLEELSTEVLSHGTHTQLFAEFKTALQAANDRLLLIDPATYESPRVVGRARLPTTVGGLLVHCAEHTQRHTGQAITTAKVLLALRPR